MESIRYTALTASGLMVGVLVCRAMMMTACDLSAITKPWEVQSKVRTPPVLLSSTALEFPGGSDSKESTYNTGDLGFILGLGKSQGEENGYLLHYSCLENSMDRGA